MNLPKFVGSIERAGDEDSAEQAIVDFCKHLCSSILQHTYYDPDHPQLARIVEESSQYMKALRGKWSEVTFTADAWRERPSIVLEGAFAEPVPLDTLIEGLSGQEVMAKLYDFCERSGVVSLSIKTAMNRDEFKRFVGVFVQHRATLERDGESTHASFTEALDNAHVLRIRAILESDLIDDQRMLPWRVALALARLRKDLVQLPLFRDADPEKIRAAKLQVFGDILKPLQSELFLTQLFVNLDLILGEVSVLGDVDLERDLINSLSSERLKTLARSLLRTREEVHDGDTSEVFPAESPLDIAETLDRQLGKLGTRLGKIEEDADATTLVRQLFDIKLVPMANLPVTMRRDIQLDRWIEDFLRDPTRCLHRFDLVSQQDAYADELETLLTSVARLATEGQETHVTSIVGILEKHRETREDRFTKALESADCERVVDRLVDAIEATQEDDRQTFYRTLAVMGESAAVPLTSLLSERVHPETRSVAAQALACLADRATGALLALLEDPQVSEVTACPALRALAEGEPSDAVARTLTRLAGHRRETIRSAAIGAASQVFGPKALKIFARALSDESPRIVCLAIRCLSEGEVHDPGFASWLKGTLDPSQSETAPDDLSIQAAAARALARMDPSSLGNGVEALLLTRLQSLKPSRVKQLLSRRENPDTSGVENALIDALGALGGPPALRWLREVPKDSPGRERADAAIHEIESRLH